MTKNVSISRLIDGVVWRCTDVGCDDFVVAARNRERIANQESIIGYIQAETAVTKTPLMQELARWIPVGTPQSLVFLPASVAKLIASQFDKGTVVDDEPPREELDRVLPRRGTMEEAGEIPDEDEKDVKSLC